MDMLKQLNAAADYIETHLCETVEPSEAAKRACVTEDSFLRFFSYMTGMTLAEYIRRRRLTLAAEDLRNSDMRILDIAVKYGWESADAFSRAFTRQHGISPGTFRKSGGSLKVYSPVSFRIHIQGAKEMDLRFIELSETKLLGISRQYDGEGYETREALRHILWSDEGIDVPLQLCEGTWNQTGSTAFDGVWFGLWYDGRYMIARAPEDVKPGCFEEYTLPAGTYAALKTGCGGKAWEEFPRLFDLIFESWLPSSEWKLRGDLIAEVLHLQTDHDRRQKERWYEVWIPVERK
ncbi:MAG: AraC family transcriptional regulator [Oscillospiraceae bacterium]|nr:AraC family transcriptional regulator [Oscillospiraceae bacterium]